MYLISQVFQKSRANVGIYKCNVFKIAPGQWFNTETQQYETRDIKHDVTEEICGMFGIIYKKGNARVYHGSGTGVMVIEDKLKKRFGVNTIIFDVSVF